jgi:hypothetical protein
MTTLLNPTDHPVGTRLLMRYPSDVEPITYSGRFYETKIEEWSLGGRIKTLHCGWKEPKDMLLVEVLP